MLEDIKNTLRVSGNDLDTEIQDLIESAKADLVLSGVHQDKINDGNPLIKRAVILYCKANFGYDDPAIADRFLASYNALKHHLTLSSEYTGGA